jgi:epoxide hydrolase 4
VAIPVSTLSGFQLQAPNAPHPGWKPRNAIPSNAGKAAMLDFFRLPWLPELVLKARNHAALEQAFASSPGRDAFSDDVMERYRESWRQPGGLSGMLNWYRALLRFGIDLPPPSSIAVPTLICWGDKDGFAEPSLAEASARLCADVRVRHFPDATHWLVHDQPDDVAQEISDFLRTGPCS